MRHAKLGQNRAQLETKSVYIRRNVHTAHAQFVHHYPDSRSKSLRRFDIEDFTKEYLPKSHPSDKVS